mgnify:CR=1 FL=1|jgi:hypothetical protein
MIEVMFGLVALVVGLPILACTLAVIAEFIADLKELRK